MKVYQAREKITLAFSTRGRKKYVEVKFGSDDIRLLLSKEQGVLFDNNRAYLPVDSFVLSDFFKRYVEQAFVDYSQIIEAPEKKQVVRPELPAGFLEKLEQMRYSDHTIRVYTTYFGDFQVHDINISRSLIHVRQGKGKKDRYTLLSKPLVGKLSEYKQLYHPQTWLFEREAGVQFSESIVSKKLKEIAVEAGITKRVYPHLFRHSFATHLLEQGTDLGVIKELLGHNNIKTTEMYVHIADTYKSKIRSPLDDILEDEE